jgi:hypothetical protein
MSPQNPSSAGARLVPVIRARVVAASHESLCPITNVLHETDDVLTAHSQEQTHAVQAYWSRL